jgi:hypothetical protein
LTSEWEKHGNNMETKHGKMMISRGVAMGSLFLDIPESCESIREDLLENDTSYLGRHGMLGRLKLWLSSCSERRT